MIIYPYNLSQEKLALLRALTENFEQGKGDKQQLNELEELLSLLVVEEKSEN
ncbi:hypothetical protein LP316_01495 [Thalassotalea sp. LPB0316]|uniref:hypothetical protein n=1 Tax=Thalassotalea sp. LPB0316 TaxID=2769490 RepID=UPI0018678520|nr:hypothetical protein [Thalassotalea sp. LPB0316]QOL26016.1 hypothetical protein LP316_01495 [Thalassotalea sp. LPB0316]